ncbi:MAG: amidohydrolase [Sandaracinaceae bacterium]|nr:amidohydrolase [Sandaracinaceae bacterium]
MTTRTSPSRTSVIGAAVIGLAVLATAVALFWPREPTPRLAARHYADIPRIDVHVHVPPEQADRAIRMFREQGGVLIALNASGGHPDGGGLEENIEIMQRTHGALRPYCNLDFRNVEEPDWEAYVDRTLHACRDEGAVGLKIFKGLGLGIPLSDGSLLAVDDPRLDHAFDLAGELGLPILIHTGDPQAFFRPDGPDNERHAELAAHPSWSFYGPRPDGMGDWPSWQSVFDQYEHRVARHPHTTFVGAHFGNAPEEPDTVARMLEAYPNLVVETGARIPEIGRHDAHHMHDLFVRFADRILFGTDFQIGGDGRLVLGSAGREPDPPSRVPLFYEAHFRYFETADRHFAHPSPIQGDWTIDGIDLPREVLEKIYFRNAMRIFDLPDPRPAPASH